MDRFNDNDLKNFISEIKENSTKIYLREKEIFSCLSISEVNAASIFFSNVNFNEGASFDDINSPELTITFVNCKFRNVIGFKKLNISRLEFLECEGELLFISNCKIGGYLYLRYNKIEDVNIIKLISQEISIIGNVGGKISIDYLVANKFNVKNNSNQLIVNNIKDLRCEIKILTIESNIKYDGANSFLNCDLGIVFLKGISNSILEFNYCKVNTIDINHFVNISALRFIGIEFENESFLNIKSSDLGKTVLFNVDFNKLNKFNLSAFNISEIVVANVNWCEKTKRIGSDKNMADSELRDLFKQIKSVATRQNNKIEELKFHGLEMVYYKKELNKQNGKFNDKLILGFNEFTNNHGSSWTRPLVLIILIIIPTYFLIKCKIGYQEINVKYFWINFAEILECINPIRKFSECYGQNGFSLNTKGAQIARVLDFFLRISIGLLLFQLVRAFRKYVK